LTAAHAYLLYCIWSQAGSDLPVLCVLASLLSSWFQHCNRQTELAPACIHLFVTKCVFKQYSQYSLSKIVPTAAVKWSENTRNS